MHQKPKKTVEYVIFQTNWGHFGLAATQNALLRTHLPAQNRRKVEQNLLSGLDNTKYNPLLFKPLQDQITAYFVGQPAYFDPGVPVLLDDLTPFTQLVLNACRKIDFGQTISYADLAKKIGRPAAARAVGTALAKNPLPLIIGCHRVIKTDGSLGGFSATAGIEMKQKMLSLEHQAHLSSRT